MRRSRSSEHKLFGSDNPPNGAIIDYYVKTKIEGPAPQAVAGGGGGGRGGGGGGGGFGGGFGGLGPRVDPGTYTVKVAAAGKEVTKTLVVEEHPRIEISAADRVARRAAINSISQVIGPMITTQRGLQSLRSTLNTSVEGWKRPGPGGARVPEAVLRAGEDYLKRIDAVYPAFANIPQAAAALGAAGPPLVFQGPAPLQRLQQIMGAMEQLTYAPSEWQTEQIRILSAKVQEAMPKARHVLDELPAFNKMMNDARECSTSTCRVDRAGDKGGRRKNRRAE